MANAIVVLDKPLVGHGVIRQLEFREPKWDEIMDIGDPYVWTPAPGDDRHVVATPIPEAVKRYADRLIADGDKPGDPMLLPRLGIRDTFNVRDAIMAFFLGVDPRVLAGSTPSPTSSSSIADGSPTPSEG
ncbi:hypothetical protein [uncultured Methylobacterium sp.]|uniref:hypothetical protein n=1 Tax=uncultured Methylobacterium sp. TaxID=157278 RepID=UPI0035CA8BFF